ncbi:hypothetical protein GNF40_06505 [Clostridium perfringens]|jgi:hypothetical protein|nr:hypothetical protein [Clostridium perfringens]MDZ5005787.1 hypothetical protein [Clostridium perfringens]
MLKRNFINLLLKGNDDKVYKPPRGMNSKVVKIYAAIVGGLKHAKVLSNLDIDFISITVNNTKLYSIILINTFINADLKLCR